MVTVIKADIENVYEGRGKKKSGGGKRGENQIVTLTRLH